MVAEQELRDLWLSGRGIVLVLIFSLLLSVLTYLASTNKELNFLDQKDTVNLIMQMTLGIGIALSLLFSADALSGERERGTLETLLLTPLSPREIAIGKLLGALSVWPVIMAVSIPYVWALRAGPGLFLDTMVTGLVVGTLLVSAFASLGIIVSTFSNSNRVSLSVSFLVFVVLMAPAQLPGAALKGWLGSLLTHINPVTAGARFLSRIVVDDHTWGQEATLLIAPILASAIVTAAAFFLTSRLRLQGGFGR